MRTLSLPLEEYENDLSKSETQGRKEALRRFLLIAEYVKKDPKEAITMIIEDFEDDQKNIDRLLIAFGLMDLAEQIWGSKEPLKL